MFVNDIIDSKTYFKVRVYVLVFAIVALFCAFSKVSYASGSGFSVSIPGKSALATVLSKNLGLEVNELKYSIVEEVTSDQIVEGFDLLTGEDIGLVFDPPLSSEVRVVLNDGIEVYLCDRVVLSDLVDGPYAITNAGELNIDSLRVFRVKKNFGFKGNKVIAYDRYDIDFGDITRQNEFWELDTYWENPAEDEFIGRSSFLNVDLVSEDPLVFVVSDDIVEEYGIFFDECDVGSNPGSYLSGYVECIDLENSVLVSESVVSIGDATLVAVAYYPYERLVKGSVHREVMPVFILSSSIFSVRSDSFISEVLSDVKNVIEKGLPFTEINKILLFRDVSLYAGLILVVVSFSVFTLLCKGCKIVSFVDFSKEVVPRFQRALRWIFVVGCGVFVFVVVVLRNIAIAQQMNLSEYIESVILEVFATDICIDCYLYDNVENVKFVLGLILLVVLFAYQKSISDLVYAVCGKASKSVKVVLMLFFVGLLGVGGLFLILGNLSVIYVLMTFSLGFLVVHCHFDGVIKSLRVSKCTIKLTLVFLLVISACLYLVRVVGENTDGYVADVGLFSDLDPGYFRSDGHRMISNGNRYLFQESSAIGSRIFTHASIPYGVTGKHVEYTGTIISNSRVYLSNNFGMFSMCMDPKLSSSDYYEVGQIDEYKVFGRNDVTGMSLFDEDKTIEDNITSFVESGLSVAIEPLIIHTDPYAVAAESLPGQIYLGSLIGDVDNDGQDFQPFEYEETFIPGSRAFGVKMEGSITLDLVVNEFNLDLYPDDLYVTIATTEGEVMGLRQIDDDEVPLGQSGSKRHMSFSFEGLEDGMYILSFRRMTAGSSLLDDVMISGLSINAQVTAVFEDLRYRYTYGSKRFDTELAVNKEYLWRESFIPGMDVVLGDKSNLCAEVNEDQFFVLGVNRRNLGKYDVIVVLGGSTLVKSTDEGRVEFSCSYVSEVRSGKRLVQDIFVSDMDFILRDINIRVSKIQDGK